MSRTAIWGGTWEDVLVQASADRILMGDGGMQLAFYGPVRANRLLRRSSSSSLSAGITVHYIVGR